MLNNEQGVKDFLTSMGVRLDGNQAKNWSMNFQESVLLANKERQLLNYSYPMKVAKIIDTPRGPTQFQDFLKGLIVPNYTTNSSESQILVGEGLIFLNAVILYLYDLFKRGDYTGAYGLIEYLKTFEDCIPGLNPEGIWTVSSKSGNKFFKDGQVSENQAGDPYAHQKEIFGE